MGAEASAPLDAQQGLRPCRPPSDRRLRNGSDPKIIAEPEEHPPKEGQIDRTASLGLLCAELKCHQISHSSRYFIDHLLRVSFLLEDWGCSREACLCGLFHSVYGTEKFTHSCLPWAERDRLRGVIGDSAEELVYMFCTTSSKDVWKLARAAAQQDGSSAASGRAVGEAAASGELFRLPNSHTQGWHAVRPQQLGELIEVKLSNQIEQGMKRSTFADRIEVLEQLEALGAKKTGISVSHKALVALKDTLEKHQAGEKEEGAGKGQGQIDGEEGAEVEEEKESLTQSWFFSN